MPAKKKVKKKTRTKKAGKKQKPTKKLARKAAIRKKKSAKKTPVKKRSAVKAKAKKASKARTRKKTRTEPAFLLERPRARSGGQSGDLQGLSDVEGADSESVDELLEEGNAFEAGVIAGVERAGNTAERGVRTREVLEDDVPEEYLDKD